MYIYICELHEHIIPLGVRTIMSIYSVYSGNQAQIMAMLGWSRKISCSVLL